ncbi:MAG: uroporphyrinogen decarboxylase family protein [Candidatus Aminicenantaceae bacterium]
MTRYERLEAAWNLKEPDRVPVTPINCYIIAYLGGITIKEMFTCPEKLIRATIKCSDIIGDNVDPNITTLDHFSILGKSGWDQATLDWRIEDHFPPQGNIPSFFEKCIIEDYEDVMERGFSTILFNKKICKDVFERSIDEFLFYEFEYPSIYAQAWRKYVEEYEVPLLMGGRACHPLDLLQYYRGISQLTEDIFERPEKVKEMCEFLLEYEITRAMQQAMTMGAGEVPGAEVIFFINGGPPGMPPRIFNEFYWPYAKKAVDTWVKRGFKVYNHWDNDLTPHLETIRDITKSLPPGKVCIDFEKTDMKKAKEILGDKVCIHGNVPSSLLVYGTPEEVDKYCKKLIEDCAEGGGYILGTECETPWNANPENVRAMIEAANRYGHY